MRRVAKPSRFNRQLEHPLQSGELAINAGVRGALALPIRRVFLDPLGRDVHGAIQRKPRFHVFDREADGANGSQSVDLVVGQKRIRQIFERDTLLDGTDQFSVRRFADTLLEELERLGLAR